MDHNFSEPLKYNPIREAKDETRHFEIKPLDPDKLIKKNELKEITNPTFFNGDNSPTKDGLLSNEIFGLTKEDRGNTFAYISLEEYFFNPIFYKIWSRMDSRIIEIVHETKHFTINDNGDLVQDEEKGKTGIKFLRDNIDIIKIKTTYSEKRDRNIKFLKENIDTMFIKNFIVIPAYYRDIKTSNGYVGVGEINKMYASLIVSVKALRDSREYGLHITGATRGRIQELLLQIYNWFANGSTSTGGKDGVGISGKFGVMRRANLNKTTDYSSRLVLSAPNLRCENIDDLMVDLDYCALPLASACVNFYPYMIYNIRRFFENEFSSPYYNYIDKSGKVQRVQVKDYQIEFSDERIKKELDRYIHGFSNRLIPIEVPNNEGKHIKMRFKGRSLTSDQVRKGETDSNNTIPVNRDLTWCDVFYLAAVESTQDKMVLITRYPMDSYFNQFTQKVRISTTKNTEPIIVNGTVYKRYPKIRQEDIGSNTSSMFIDTLNIQNAHLKKIGGDYDGDQVTVKPIYSVEANKECEDHLKSKSNYFSLGASNIKKTSNEGVQVLYNLTLSVSDNNELQTPKFKK